MGNDDEFEWDETTMSGLTDVKQITQTQRKRPCVLKQTEGPGAPQGFVLGEETMVLGRSKEADIRIESSEVSRRHLLFRKIGPEYSCLDLNSHNGVYLNGVKIHSAILKDGDTIQAGNVILKYREGA